MGTLDYPSQQGEAHGPPEPMLLDTCVIQNIDWVWDRIEEDADWTEERVAELEATFGRTFADDLIRPHGKDRHHPRSIPG